MPENRQSKQMNEYGMPENQPSNEYAMPENQPSKKKQLSMEYQKIDHQNKLMNT